MENHTMVNESVDPIRNQSGSVIYQAKFIDVDGIRTRYYDEGKGEAMVLIHGSRFSPWGSANTWTLNIGGLSKRFRVLAADKLGSGMTNNPKSKDGYTQHAIVQHMYRFHAADGRERIPRRGAVQRRVYRRAACAGTPGAVQEPDYRR
jgi:hypothetical protein